MLRLLQVHSCSSWGAGCFAPVPSLPRNRPLQPPHTAALDVSNLPRTNAAASPNHLSARPARSLTLADVARTGLCQSLPGGRRCRTKLRHHARCRLGPLRSDQSHERSSAPYPAHGHAQYRPHRRLQWPANPRQGARFHYGCRTALCDAPPARPRFCVSAYCTAWGDDRLLPALRIRSADPDRGGSVAACGLCGRTGNEIEIWWGIVLGMLLIMSAYNLLLYITLREVENLVLAIFGPLVATSSAIAGRLRQPLAAGGDQQLVAVDHHRQPRGGHQRLCHAGADISGAAPAPADRPIGSW